MTASSFLRRGVVCLLGSVLLSACASQPKTYSAPEPALDAKLDSALHRGQTGSAHYEARVIDLETGRELYSVDADSPYMPASNGKLAVDTATLDHFGSKHIFKTYLTRDGDDLCVIGTGDPGIGDNKIAKKYGEKTMSVFDHWADALIKRGMTHIKGKLIYDDRAFDDEWTNPTWSRGYQIAWYAAPTAGLTFNNNCIDVKLKPTEEGQPTRMSVIPPTQNVKIINQSVTGKGKKPDIDREPKADVFTITGATTRPTTMPSVAITNPGAFFADALRTRLASRGITIDGPTVRADHALMKLNPPPADSIIAVAKTKLTDDLWRINKDSQNNCAEAFCKMLGRDVALRAGKDEPGSWANGGAAVKAFLNRHDIDTSKLVIVDGSGLSRRDRVTGRLISDLLVMMWHHPEHKAFFDSLTISGTDGTIKDRLKDLKGRVHAKTGYIGGVRSLSGYVQNDRGHWLVFTIIYNGIQGGVKPYEQMQDAAVRVLAAWPGTAGAKLAQANVH